MQEIIEEVIKEIKVERKEPVPIEEMNGIIVYDSYALLTGCSKIVEYHKKAK